MRRLILISLACAAPLPAQSVVTITPQQCVWHAGDNPAWAAPTLDESDWQSYSEWHPDVPQSHLWIRCHADLNSLANVAQPALQISFYSTYEIYFNGDKIGTFGNLQNGIYGLDAIRSWPIAALPASGRSVVALRVNDRGVAFSPGPVQHITEMPLEIHAADASILEALRARQVLTGASKYLLTTLCYGIVGVLSLPLLALYFFDRSRITVLLLALAAIALSVLRINEFAAATFSPYSLSVCLAIPVVFDVLLVFTEFPFFFMLAKGRIPIGLWGVLGLAILTFVPNFCDYFAFFNPHHWYGPLFLPIIRPLSFCVYFLIALMPFAAFWPYSSISRRMRPLAAFCLFWGTVDFIWFAIELTAVKLPGIPNLYARWGQTLLDARGIATACVVAALVILLFREQRQITLDRAMLAGELHAAGEIQRMLAPAEIETAPGLHINVAFHPMREVGGDFYLCRVLPNGNQRILLGDVSGKGAAAAMAATLLMGAAEERGGDSPAELLSHLNRVLCRARIGGFATCLCADVLSSGEMIIANAGHLSPYRGGIEVATPAGLPLGIIAEAEYTAARIRLGVSDELTFVSDGVVEARNSTGELFGFERTASISTLSAESIAQTVQKHGQEDDITVLTLTLAPAGVVHA